MSLHRPHDLTQPEERALATLVARVSDGERAGIAHLARVHDRTPSREIRRAIRFYLNNFDLVDRALRDQATAKPSSLVEVPR
jgi:hypothetical protein